MRSKSSPKPKLSWPPLLKSTEALLKLLTKALLALSRAFYIWRKLDGVHKNVLVTLKCN
jgi:hypothetical protein